MGILDGIVDGITNTLGDVVDSTSSKLSLTPGFDINTPDSGFFTGVEDAMSRLGGELRSPAFASVDKMKNAATSLNITQNLDLYTLQQGFGEANANQMWDTLQEVQGLSDAMDSCGNYAQDLLSSATTDYIKNTGIQEAGRELANKLESIGAGGAADCIVGFATLFDSAGIIDDALGLGDLTQIQSRIGDVIRDATDPNKLSNMLVNLDAVQGLLGSFNDMCTGMKDALNKLVAADLASLNATLNKLAQWAAFAKIATSDPCALVNNNKMLSHITAPVMDDIVKLYNKATGSDNFGPQNPIIPLGEILGTKPKFPDIPRYNQAEGEGLVSFQSFKSNIPGEFITVTQTIEKESLSFVEGQGWITIPNTSVPMDFVDGEWVENAAMKTKSSFTQGISNGVSTIDDSTQSFINSKEIVAFNSIIKSPSNIQSIEGIVDELGETVEDVVEDVLNTVTRVAAAVLTLLAPKVGSGADETSGDVGKTKLRSINKLKIQGRDSVEFSKNDGPKKTTTDETELAIPVKTKQNYAFNRGGIVLGKKVCTCHNPTISKGKDEIDPMTNSAACVSSGGVWKCATDNRIVNTPSSDTFVQEVNIELKNALPTNKPFDVSKVGE